MEGKAMTEQQVESGLTKLANEATRRHKVIDKAKLWMRRQIDADAELREAIMDEVIDRAFLRSIYISRQADKREVKANVCTRGIAAMAAVSDCAGRGLLSIWLTPDGRPLGNIYGRELDAMAGHEFALASGHEKNARFFHALSMIVPADRMVKQAMNDQQAAELWAKASGDKTPAAPALAAAGG